MAELAINTIIRIILIIVVIVVIGVSLFLLWSNYLEPWFSGLGNNEALISGFIMLGIKRKL